MSSRLKYQTWQPGEVEEDDPSYVMGGGLEGVARRELSLSALEPEAVLDTSVYELIFPDVSSWQGDIDWDVMAAKAQAVIIRAGYGNTGIDTRVREYVAEARARGLVVGLYWYARIGLDFKKHIESFREICDELKPDLPAVWDCEKTEYTENVKNSTTGWLGKLDSNWITATKKEAIYYTRASWWDWNTYRTDWPKMRDLWTAHYTTAAQPLIPADWGQVANPRTWTFWQFSADGNGLGSLYGVSSRSIDLNRYNGTKEEFVSKFGVTLPGVEPEPEPEPEPVQGLKFRVAVPKLNVRTGPGTQYRDIGDLAGNDVVTALNVNGADAWIEIEPGKWACVQKAGTQYMTKVD